MGDGSHYHSSVKAPKTQHHRRVGGAEAHRELRRTRPAAPAQAVPGDRRHAIMLALAITFLAAVGLVLPHGDSGAALRYWLLTHPLFPPLIAALWALFFVEGVAGVFYAPDAWPSRVKRLLLTSLLPPLRMVIATSAPQGRLWLPGVGWTPTGEDVSEQLEQKFALPMLVLALLVLPVLAVEFTMGEALDSRPSLAVATHLITCVIWVGFTAEFVWMVAAAPKRLTYCRKNWINLVIIVVPLVAFLRVLRLFRLARVLRAGRLLRAYRLRGLLARVLRLALLFNLLERLQQRDPVKYCAALEAKAAELERELAELHAKLETAREKLPPPPAA